MTATAITSVFNDAYIAEVYDAYRRDPSSVDGSWRQYFQTAEQLAALVGARPGAADGAAAPADVIKDAGDFIGELAGALRPKS